MSCCNKTTKMKKAKRNGNPIKQWALTFPQSGDVTKQEFIEKFPPREYAACTQELHKDGNPHLHATIILKRAITKPKMKNWIEARFPNDWKRIWFEGTKWPEKWGDYCFKEDPNWLIIDNRKTREKFDPIKEDKWIHEQVLKNIRLEKWVKEEERGRLEVENVRRKMEEERILSDGMGITEADLAYAGII